MISGEIHRGLVTISKSRCYRTAIRFPRVLLLMPEYHDVACPSSGTTRSYPETMTHGSRKCGYGASYRMLSPFQQTRLASTLFTA
jgi:hypothetical protein